MDSAILDQLRKKIDNLDEELLKILSQRTMIVSQIGKQKKNQGLEPLDEKRMNEVLQKMLDKGRELNLSDDFIKKLHALIHEYSLEVEKK